MEKATLSLVLYANDVVVERSENAILWRHVLGEIQSPNESTAWTTNLEGAMHLEEFRKKKGEDFNSVGPDRVSELANELNVNRDQLEEACSPLTDEPYMVLNAHNWEELGRQVRGPRIAPTAAVATLLLLWFRRAGLGNVTHAQIRAVISKLGVPDKNPSRSIKNARWLRALPSQIALNPGEISRAKRFAACFCTKDWSPWLEARHS
jgi:hypothetical protein